MLISEDNSNFKQNKDNLTEDNQTLGEKAIDDESKTNC